MLKRMFLVEHDLSDPEVTPSLIRLVFASAPLYTVSKREFEKAHETASRRVIRRIMATKMSASVVCGKRS
jgi:hypothetical protein